jgi:hypothetical protein
MAIRGYKAVAGILGGLMLLASTASMAAPTLEGLGSDGSSEKLGDVINNVTNAFGSFPTLISAVIYIAGIFFATAGIFKFKDHVDNPSQHPLSAGVKRFLAGGLLLAAPYTSSALYGSLFKGGIGSNRITDIGGGGRHGDPGGDGLDQMIWNLVYNVAGPMETLLIAFTYISAIILMTVGIVRLTKTAQEGPRGPAGLGTMMTFLASGALFAFGDMMGTFSTSLFGDTTISTYAQVDSSIIADEADQAKIGGVIEAVMSFVMIVGFIAFIRGWFVLKAFADGGSGNASVAQALTFLFGGALAINLGDLINVLQKTAGVSGITFG